MPSTPSSKLSESGFSNHRKMSFQTKYKKRGTNEMIPSEPRFRKAQSSDGLHHAFTQRVRESSHQSPQQINKSHILLSKAINAQHSSENCHCNECLCGRHMCKLHDITKPDLKKSSTYSRSFRKAKSVFRSKSFAQDDAPKSLPKVEMNSTYSFNFRQSPTAKVEKPRPSDNIHFEGPMANITSYRLKFPGNRGGNPYVRPKQLKCIGGDFQYKDKHSIYKKSFVDIPLVKTESQKSADHLKSGDMSCFKESFYGQKFKTPNPQDYSEAVKNIEKRQINPNSSHLFKSTYKGEFIPSEMSVCPAKIKMESKFKDSLALSKLSFNENSDYKAMENSFHALSMAPPGIF